MPNSFALGTQNIAQIADNSGQTEGANCFVIYPPYGIEVAVANLMPVLSVSVSESSNFASYYLDSNTSVSYLWSQNCTMSGPLGTASCSEDPVNAVEANNVSNWN